MKKLYSLFVALAFCATGFAQANGSRLPAIDKSPMDMAYYPVNYPVLKIQDKASEPLIARVIYSRPQKNNRVVFGELVEYNQVWRMGANEATTFETDKAIKINGQELPAGKYSVFGLMDGEKFSVIFNSEWKIWGTNYEANKEKTVLTVPAKLSTTEKIQETLVVPLLLNRAATHWSTSVSLLTISPQL